MADESLLTVARRVGELLKNNNLMLSTAESCTGGLVAAAITHWAGASQWFDNGIVCYSNRAKEQLLQVPAALLREHGAVSEPVAAAMCEGAGDTSLAITGIAGPGGEKVGMVCFAWMLQRRAITETKHFLGSREQIRQAAAHYSLSRMATLLNDTG